MEKLVFATNNPHKLTEIRAILGNKFEVVSLNDLKIDEEIPEEQDTLEGNASQKAWYIYDKYGYNCFADDTGLEIEALNGEPGVYSARYAGESKSAADNIAKVLDKLRGVENRSAKFRTVVSIVENGEEKQFEGSVNGNIIAEEKGTEGFGYDPIFIPEDFEKTFAELDLATKNTISHRGRAVKKLANYLLTRK